MKTSTSAVFYRWWVNVVQNIQFNLIIEFMRNFFNAVLRLGRDIYLAKIRMQRFMYSFFFMRRCDIFRIYNSKVQNAAIKILNKLQFLLLNIQLKLRLVPFYNLLWPPEG